MEKEKLPNQDTKSGHPKFIAIERLTNGFITKSGHPKFIAIERLTNGFISNKCHNIFN